jgi:cell division septal protein FtsQ
MKQQRNRRRQKQINILHTTVRKRHSRKQLTTVGLWSTGVVVILVALIVALHFGLGFAADHLLYQNPRYTLKKIEIQPNPDHFSPRSIRQAAGLELGPNLWTLNLPQITSDLEKLSYVSSARVERHYPDKIVIRIVERQPVVKIVGINDDLRTRETFYLDHDCIVLKPREGEPVPPNMPEVIGLTNAELQPGMQLDQSNLRKALDILDAIDKTTELNTAISIRSIDLSQPLSITMTTTRDLAITFRLDYIDQQMVRLQQIFETFVDKEQRTLHTVDLTPNINVPITFYE